MECVGMGQVGVLSYLLFLLMLGIIGGSLYANIKVIRNNLSAYWWIGFLFSYLFAGIFILQLRASIEAKHSLPLCSFEPLNVVASVIRPVVWACEIGFVFIILTMVCIGVYRIFEHISRSNTVDKSIADIMRKNDKDS